VRNFMELFGRKPAVVWHDSKLGETLSMFRQEKSHMAVVRDVETDGEVCGFERKLVCQVCGLWWYRRLFCRATPCTE
jgi:hypothetical protein